MNELNKCTPEEIFEWWNKSEYKNTYPLNHNIIVRQDNVVTESQSGVIINIDTRNYKKPQTGLVLAVGSKCSKTKAGDSIFFSMYSGVHLVIDGIDFIVMKENEIFGVIDNRFDIQINTTHNVDGLIDMVDQKYSSDYAE